MTDGDKEYQTIVLSALLHDIGKLIQRGKFLHLDQGQHPKFSADFPTGALDPIYQSDRAGMSATLVAKAHSKELILQGGLR